MKKLCIINSCEQSLVSTDILCTLQMKFDISIITSVEYYVEICSLMNIKIYKDVFKAVSENEIFIIPVKYPYNRFKELKEIIDVVIRNNKLIWSFTPFLNNCPSSLQNYDNFFNFCRKKKCTQYCEKECVIRTPMIYICGNNINTSKNYISMLLANRFEDFGAKVVNFSNNEYADILGQRFYGDYFFDNSIPVETRFTEFRKEILEIEQEIAPDLFIFTIPQRMELSSLGRLCIPDVFHYMDTPEYTVLSILTNGYSDMDIDRITNFSINGKVVDYFFVSKNTFNLLRANEDKIYEEVVASNKTVKNSVLKFQNKKGINNITMDYSVLIDKVWKDFMHKYYVLPNIVL